MVQLRDLGTKNHKKKNRVLKYESRPIQYNLWVGEDMEMDRVMEFSEISLVRRA